MKMRIRLVLSFGVIFTIVCTCLVLVPSIVVKLVLRLESKPDDPILILLSFVIKQLVFA
jgi:hypothetical protein